MTPAGNLLNHFDRIAGSEPNFHTISPDGASPAMHVALYSGFPEPGAVTGFTIGLSHFHPSQGGHKELTISMRSTEIEWALACGFTAYQLRETCPFNCGDTVNFHEKISASSGMNGFLVTHPAHIATNDATVDLGFRKVELVELVPLYEQERLWILAGGNTSDLLQSCPRRDFMNPKRVPYSPPTIASS